YHKQNGSEGTRAKPGAGKHKAHPGKYDFADQAITQPTSEPIQPGTEKEGALTMQGNKIIKTWKVARVKQGFLKQLAFLSLLASTAQADSFFKDHARGWHWYEPMPLAEEEESLAKPQAQEQALQGKQASPSPKTPTELVKAYREELE